MSLSPVPEPSSAPSGALQRLRDLNEGEVILEPRKIPVYLECRSMRDAFEDGLIPKPVVARVLEAMKDGRELTDEEVEQIGEEAKEADDRWEVAVRGFVASCIRKMWGEPVEMTAQDTYQFSEREFNELRRYCMREAPLPGKG